MCVLGGGMYPGYEQYWTSILADPAGVLEFTGRPPTQGEIDYANWADQTRSVGHLDDRAVLEAVLTRLLTGLRAP
jgi:hypothetical protein